MQVSPNQHVTFSPEEFPEVEISYKPATGPQKTKYIGDIQRGCNMGELAVSVCKKHVRDISGVSFSFDHRQKGAFDEWQPAWFMETLNEIAFGSTMTGEDAKNSD